MPYGFCCPLLSQISFECFVLSWKSARGGGGVASVVVCAGDRPMTEQHTTHHTLVTVTPSFTVLSNLVLCCALASSYSCTSVDISDCY